MSYSHETICKYLNWIACTPRIAGRFPSQHALHQLCRKRWWGHPRVNLQIKPLVYQHFRNKQLFPNGSSSSDMLMQHCGRSVGTHSTATIYHAVRAHAVATPPQRPAVIGPFIPQAASFCIPLGKCSGTIRDFPERTPIGGRRWEVGVEK